jgi:hypothetical protein
MPTGTGGGLPTRGNGTRTVPATVGIRGESGEISGWRMFAAVCTPVACAPIGVPYGIFDDETDAVFAEESLQHARESLHKRPL